MFFSLFLPSRPAASNGDQPFSIALSIGLEEQNGFMIQRGCCDSIFTVKMTLQKRHEHGLSTWAVFIDLVKASDSVPRNGLFAVLQKFGIPPKILRLIVRFH